MKRLFFILPAFLLTAGITHGQNTSFGGGALGSITTGTDNSAFGENALRLTTTGNYNTATGHSSLLNNISGDGNTANGTSALLNNTTGIYNVSCGLVSMHDNTTGSFNVAVGTRALSANQTGDCNVGIGLGSGPNVSNLSNTIAIGCAAVATASDQARIGNTSTVSIGGYANWTNLSDGRFKINVEENVIGLDFINGLRPVSYVVDTKKLNDFLKIESDCKDCLAATPVYQTGFIAQEVEELTVSTGFTAFNGVDKPKNESDHYGLRYSEFVVPLVKAVQELDDQQEVLLSTIKSQQETIKQQQEKIDQLLKAAGLEDESSTPANKAELYQNVPNPSSGVTEIRMNLPETTGRAQIVIYNLEGKELRSYPVSGTGQTSLKIDAGAFEAGMYLYALLVDNTVVSTKQMILTR